jgi:aspartokinase
VADARSIAVVKIGGSVLTGPQAYRRAASFLADVLLEHPGQSIVAVVSAECGVTDALLATARDIVEAPDQAVVDLLWSTGEIRSAAILALSLHALGVRAAALNVHQTGLVEPEGRRTAGGVTLQSLRLRAALAVHDVVVVPGFLARGAGDAIVSLGRGGSDLTAVLLAAGLRAERCELVKDVPGYFDADPHVNAGAQAIPSLTFETALAMARDGCELVQTAALEAARSRGVPLVVRALDGHQRTRVSDSDFPGGPSDGVFDTDHSRGTAVRAGHRLADCPDLPDVDLRAGSAGVPPGI